MRFGVCYYPEHWPEDRWETDARMMQTAGIEIVRIGEFAWAFMEPAEGQFEWSWLDRSLETLASFGMEIVLGTPTAAPPAWVSYKYPDILPVDEQGRRRRHGGRRHYCPSNKTFHRLSRRIVAEMAQRYGKHPQVIGWQVDNEFGGGYTARCYCDNCARRFQGWLADRYDTLESLNQAWGTGFWSQIYSDWSQIQPPNLVLGRPNPSHVLDYHRFASDSFIAYQQIQIGTLRDHIREGSFITHNFMGHFQDLDYFKLAAPLDLVTWDSYPTGLTERHGATLYSNSQGQQTYPEDVGDPTIIGMAHAQTYGLLEKPFWVMEQQPGYINWGSYNPGIRQGNVRLWAWHAVVEGAEAVLFFRWRACLDGQEQYHAGLLDHLGKPDVGYADLLRLVEEKEQLNEITKQPVNAEVALLFDYEDLWALDIQPHQRDFNYRVLQFTYYKALQESGIQTTILPYDADLSRYKLVIAPSVFLDRVDLSEKLQGYLKNGGSVLLGVRSGFKTLSNRVQERPLPGSFRDLIGADVESWQAVVPGVGYQLRSSVPHLGGSATLWVEGLRPDRGTNELAWYGSGPLRDQPALVENPVSDGLAYYLGWYPSIPQAKAVVNYIAGKMRIQTHPGLPPGVVKKIRGQYMIFLNFNDAEQTVMVKDQSMQIGPRDLKVVKS